MEVVWCTKMPLPHISKITLQNESGSWFYVKGIELGDSDVHTSDEVDLGFFIRQNSLWGFE